MRLLNTKTLELKYFAPHEIPDYVILSHRWGPEEVTLKDITSCPISDINCPARQLKGFAKVEGTCKLAASDGYDWVWIDSCCIDKESSADTDKSINSMWTYYTKSHICYVYMADISDSEAGWGTSFQQSEWFTRGWTLQELIAPIYVEFYAADWSPIGTKLERHEEIAEITTIDEDLLVQNQPIDEYSTAERFSWAAHRRVTQEEDEAYSLLGLFQIHMPMLYGEGRARAFARLQEAIYLSTCDDSIFLFRYSPHVDSQPLLADSATRFCQRIKCKLCHSQLRTTLCFPSHMKYSNVKASNLWPTQPHEQIITTVTSSRNEMSAPLSVLEYAEIANLLTYFDENELRTGISHVAVLNHTSQEYLEGAFCLLLYRPPDSEVPCFYRLSYLPAFLPNVGEFKSKMQKRVILIPGPVVEPEVQNVDTMFNVSGDLYLVRAWNAKYVDHHTTLRIQGSLGTKLADAKFKIRTRNEESKGIPEVSCRISTGRSRNKSPQLLVQLERIVEIYMWSIKAIYEIKPQRPRQKQGTLFLANTPSDRCTIRLSNGKKLYVSLRHLAASESSEDGGCTRQQRYQIALRER